MTQSREDLAAEVKDMLDNAAVVMVGEPKPARVKAPLPTVNFLVVNEGWDPRRDPIPTWKRMGLKEAEAEKTALEAPTGLPLSQPTPNCPVIVQPTRKMIVEATTTYRIVGGGRA